MSEREDFELEALQRQLDDAFETTRPRHGFEDELWLRMQSRRPIWRRLRDGLVGLADGIRLQPAVPAAAAAVVLVVAVGAGIFALGGFGAGRGGGTTTASQKAGASYLSAVAFGRIPGPGLRASQAPADIGPPQADGTAGPNSPKPAVHAAPYTLYFGPATLTWAGQLNLTIAEAPVYRYQEPTASSADQFGALLGATGQASHRTPGYLGTYAGQGFMVSVRGSSQLPPSEPFFFLTPTGGGTLAAAPNPADIADAFLAAHSLTPSWPSEVVVEGTGDAARVRFLRYFQVPSAGRAYLVDGSGERYGLEVDLNSGQTLRVAGPLPLSLESAPYPVITADAAIRSALASSPAGPETLNPQPAVQLTQAELVYALAWAGDHSFYEPCFLFSGTFVVNGNTYVKRVLVPAVDPSQRSS